MKKVFVLQFVFISLFVSFISCEDSTTLESYEENINLSEDEIISKKIENYKSIGTILLETIKIDDSFKTLVYSECLKQKSGDYDVRIIDLLELNQKHSFWSTETTKEIETYLENLRSLTDFEPIIFIPNVENFDDLPFQNISFDFKNSNSFTNTELVLKDEYDFNTRTCPGYIVTDPGLVTTGPIDEDDAWGRDVWVVGDAEFSLAENDHFEDFEPHLTYNDDNGWNSGGSGGSGSSTPPPTRTDGRAEYGGIIQITDRGAVEPWISGKFEMKYIVFSASGAKIKEKSFGKTKRKHFKNRRWVDYNDFIANWNTQNLGNFMIEAWIERDGGGTTTVSQTFPAPSGCTGCPSTTISYNLGNRDDDLGQSIVQFTDYIGQVYGISYSNFKRK